MRCFALVNIYNIINNNMDETDEMIKIYSLQMS